MMCQMLHTFQPIFDGKLAGWVWWIVRWWTPWHHDVVLPIFIDIDGRRFVNVCKRHQQSVVVLINHMFDYKHVVFAQWTVNGGLQYDNNSTSLYHSDYLIQKMKWRWSSVINSVQKQSFTQTFASKHELKIKLWFETKVNNPSFNTSAVRQADLLNSSLQIQFLKWRHYISA